MNNVSDAMTNLPDDEMPDEIDFSHGVRGKFFKPGVKLNLPIYLDQEVQTYLAALASKSGTPISQLANEILRRELPNSAVDDKSLSGIK